MFGFDKNELRLLKKLNSPRKIQDYLETIPINFEKAGETCMSPRRVLKEKKAHCIEGALFAAAAFWVQGERPLLLDLKTIDADEDHVVAPFRRYGHWGAIGKTNHAVLRYRDPVYKTIRELALSFFHEYYMDDGKKTLRSFSTPLDLSKKQFRGWTTAEDELWHISDALDALPHTSLLTRAQIATLRRADPVELKAGDIVQWGTK
jgi:hypothetical protein